MSNRLFGYLDKNNDKAYFVRDTLYQMYRFNNYKGVDT